MVHKAIYSKCGDVWHMTTMPESGDQSDVRVYIDDNTALILLDLSGLPLHKRGYRTDGGIAPLRETLAATLFLLSPQGIVVSAPAVTATLNGYLFLKNAVFRLLYTTFKKNTPGRELLDNLKKDSASMQKLYIPQLVQALGKVDPQTTQLFITRMQQFRPRLVMNMIENPADANKAQRIKTSCNQYLGLDIDFLGLMYRDMLQDKALSSQLPLVVYKPQSVLGQAIYRIADKVIETPPRYLISTKERSWLRISVSLKFCSALSVSGNIPPKVITTCP